MAPRRRDDDDENEDRMSYLPGSGPSLDIPEYPYDFPGAAPPGFVTAFWNPYEVKHRRRTSRAQLAVLEREFDNDPKPNAEKRRSLAAQLNMTPRAIQVWFQNRRAKIKAIKNKIPGGRGMPKLKPGEKAAARANRSVSAGRLGDDTNEADDGAPASDLWVELDPDESPLSSPGDGSFSPGANAPPPQVSDDRAKPQFTIAVPTGASSGPQSAAPSGPPSPAFPAPVQSDLLAPPSAAAMLRRGSAPAPLQGIHRARYSVFTHQRHGSGNSELEMGVHPVSPISPPDHEVAPVRRASASHVGLGRRPSLPDSHLRLPAHPYYPHASLPRNQRRGALLSPVPDVGQEQEQAQYGPLPTILPPAPAVLTSRMYRALPPGMGAVPAAHDLPTQFPTRPGVHGSYHTPARPFVFPVAGPLPAADFSFGAPEPGHGDAFNRVMGMDRESGPVSTTSEYGPLSSNPEFTHSSNSSGDFNSDPGFQNSNSDFSTNSEFAPPGSQMWDARTRFGSMASIASDVTGVSVSSTQATSVSGGLGTAGFSQECGDGNNRFPNDRSNSFGGEHTGTSRFYGHPAGFQPDVRRASCPGEFLHQFSGMGMGPSPTTSNETGPVRPSPLGRSLTIAPDARGMALVNDAKSISSPTFPAGQVDPTFPPPPPAPSVGAASGPFAPTKEEQAMASSQRMASNMSPNGQHMSNDQMRMSPTEISLTHLSPTGQTHMSQQHMNQTNLSPAQRSLVGGGFGSEQPYVMGYDTRTPPSFEASPNLTGVEVLGAGNVDALGGLNMSSMSNKDVPMLFGGEGAFDLNTMDAMPMIGQGYGMPAGGEFTFA